MSTIPTLEQVFAGCGVDPSTAPGSVLVAALRQREDAIAFSLREYGSAFGLYPQIIDEVLANGIVLGTPLPVEARQSIHSNFQSFMEELRRQQGED